MIDLASIAELPTRFGRFRIHVFVDSQDRKEHVALVHGEVFAQDAVLTRLHSECLTGDIMGSLRCDCRDQLERGLERVGAATAGILLYMRQEGRGIGLVNKVRAYRLQEQGLDTVDANLALGFKDDERDYAPAAGMLRILGVRSVSLLTNNPDKVQQLEDAGITIAARIPHSMPAGHDNAAYLATKARRSGHLIAV